MSVASVGFNPIPPVSIPDSRGHPANSVHAAKPEVKEKPEENQSSQPVSSAHDKQLIDLERIGQAFNKKLQFVVDQSSNEIIVKVIDKETDKVLKEIPPEELQRLHENLKEAIGLLFDEMV